MYERLKPDPAMVNILRGIISSPIQTVSHKPGFEGQVVTVRLALEGPGMWGLTDWRDNQEWSGIVNHSIVSASISVDLACKMSKAGYNVDPQVILNGMIVSHAGRRQWDEAGWYPDVTKYAVKKRSISNETLGLQLIYRRVPQAEFEMVVALAHNLQDFSLDPSIFRKWEYLLASYVDHRTTQRYEPLNTRMGDFLLVNFFKRDEVTPAVRENVYSGIGEMTNRQKDFRLGKTGREGITLDTADKIAEELGATPDSPRLARRELMRLILQDADTEAVLIGAGIDPNYANDQVPMPDWGDTLRLEYVAAARDSLVVAKLNGDLDKIPPNTWWRQCVERVLLESLGNHQVIFSDL